MAANKNKTSDYKYYIIYKPYGMLSQFKQDGKRAVLGELFDFEKDVYPVGRLDADSEGLLILSNDKSLNDKLLKPSNKHSRTYLAQVEGQCTEVAAAQLENGVTISLDGKAYNTLPANCEVVFGEPVLPDRHPPIRYRKYLPTSWVRLTLIEGKNRQVRKMTASVGFPTLRLVRERIEGIKVYGMQPGDVIQISGKELYAKLKIN